MKAPWALIVGWACAPGDDHDDDDYPFCGEALSEYEGGYATIDDVYADPPPCSTLIACEAGGYELRTEYWAHGTRWYYDSDGNLITADPYMDEVLEDCAKWTDRYGPPASCYASCMVEHFDGCTGLMDDADYVKQWTNDIGACDSAKR